MKVLVTHIVAMYLETTAIPDDISITTFTQLPAGDYDGIIASVNTPVRAEAIAQLPNLKIIANYGVGYDNIDVAFAKSRGIAVTNTPGVLTDATAELAWALILAVARRIGEGERLVRAGNWKGWKPDFLPGTALNGKTLAIIGAGRIGSAVGSKASAFGMDVRYWRRGDDLDELLGTADVVSLHLAQSPETETIIDARRLSLLKDGAMFINTARGALVDEAALIRELQSGRIRAGLDVYVNEPNIPDELKTLDNVVILPHMGSGTKETRQAMWDLAWANLVAGLQGNELRSPV